MSRVEMSPPGDRISFLVADDDPTYRRAVVREVERRPDLQLVGEARNGHEALEMARRDQPDVALLDVRMLGLDGLEVLAELRREEIATEVILISAVNDPPIAVRALAEGAKGYLFKSIEEDEICDHIVNVARGGTAFSPEAQRAWADEVERREHTDELTDGELEVLRLAAEGLKRPQIAERIHLSPSGVKSRFHKAYDKLGVNDRAAAVAEAQRRGYIE